MADYNQNNLRSRQMNPQNHLFWKCRGFPGRPPNWRDILDEWGWYDDEYDYFEDLDDYYEDYDDSSSSSSESASGYQYQHQAQNYYQKLVAAFSAATLNIQQSKQSTPQPEQLEQPAASQTTTQNASANMPQQTKESANSYSLMVQRKQGSSAKPKVSPPKPLSPNMTLPTANNIEKKTKMNFFAGDNDRADVGTTLLPCMCKCESPQNQGGIRKIEIPGQIRAPETVTIVTGDKSSGVDENININVFVNPEENVKIEVHINPTVTKPTVCNQVSKYPTKFEK